MEEAGTGQLVQNTNAKGSHGLAARRAPKADSWRRVHIPDVIARRNALDALERAWTLLATPGCQSLLTYCTDREGRQLSERLDSLGVDVQTYLTMVVFMDDTRHPSCRSGSFGLTAPGSRVVRLCSDELKRTWRQDPAWAVASFIHEMLHTLGLGENPPSSETITRRVLSSCHEP